MSVYHYTSARLLEKIIADGKLRPSNANGWRLLWATSSPTIDLTGQYHHEPIVARFTLHSCDFEPWMDVRGRYQEPEMQKHVDAMEQRVVNGQRGSHLEDWYVRYASLPRKRWLRIDIRDQRWQPYGSSTWRRRGSPQLAKMPWFSEQQYKNWGIDLGIDPKTMDVDDYADYCITNRTDDEEN